MHLEARLGLDPGQLNALMFDTDLWRDVSTGKLETEDYWQAVAGTIHQPPALVQELAADIWEPPEVDADVLEIIQQLHSQMRVALLSNASLGLEAHLKRLNIAHFFNPIINSARIGLRKPDPQVFAHAIHRLDVPPDSILFIDDKMRNTIVAEEMGIPSITFLNASQLAEALSTYGIDVAGESI